MGGPSSTPRGPWSISLLGECCPCPTAPRRWSDGDTPLAPHPHAGPPEAPPVQGEAQQSINIYGSAILNSEITVRPSPEGREEVGR